jgi:hypothetical protein
MPIQTFTLNILDINQVSNNIWRLTFNPNNTTLTISQSSSPITQSNTLSTVELNPFINDVANFTNSDYNAIINNAVTSRPNDKFFDVDFSSNQVTAVNEVSIISASRGIGFATPSTVPQSNYTTRRITSPRYIGKELTSAEFNEYTGPTTNFTSSLGLQIGSYPGDIAYGKTSNVGNPAVNFVFFEYLVGSSPEWGGPGVEGKTIVNIKYIIDENGNVTQPVNDVNGINLGTIQQTFNGKDNAVVLLDDNDAFGVNFSGLNGPWSIFKSGYRIEPIIYTQTGITYVPAISFTLDGNIEACDKFFKSGSDVDPVQSSNKLILNNFSESLNVGLNFLIGWTQNDEENSGFNPISTPFTIQQYDEIRFEGTEDLTFTVLSTQTVILDSSQGPNVPTLVLTMDRNIPPGINLDYFLVRRYVPDPSSILLNITKGSGGTSTGILKPEFLSPEVESKLETILSDLKTKNII